MSGFSAVEPEVLDDLLRAEGAIAERQAQATRDLRRALEGLGASRHELGPIAASIEGRLRSVGASSEALAGHVAATATMFRTADAVLDRLGSAPTTTGAPRTNGAPGASERGTILPLPDVEIEWRWPPDWTVVREWGDRAAELAVELGAGLKASAGAGLDVTREAIRAGGYADTRLGGWAAAAVGSALGPFAARLSGEAFAGVRVSAESLLHVGRDGARARLGGEAFAGARADGEARASVGPVQAGAEGAVSLGIGATAQADVDLTMQRVGGRVRFGAAFGAGLEGGLEYYLEPAWLADGLRDFGDGLVSTGDRVRDATGDALGAAADVGEDLMGGALGAGGSAARTVGGWFG